ncbi:T9SS type A sorting domain-containing protein [Pedobacter glucosidilyticus]|uniref:T9SS type A sorting domain-containing protein n=1 Tax=Pedobacter glucosidilyticus TaxID=1122941 RepID=UPI000411F0E1|nr:T9SS type A sorting domain-containing protein [Pedobacter glucosidilyticus]
MRKLYSTFLLAILLLASSLKAAQRVSIASGNWTATTTWENGIVPTAADDVIITQGHTVTQNNGTTGGVTIASLTVNGTIIFADNAQEMRVTGNFTIGTTGIYNSYGVTNNVAKRLYLGGNFINDGTADFTKNFTNTATPSLTLNGTTQQSISGTGSFGSYFQIIELNNSNGVVINTPIVIARSLILTSGTLNNQSTVTINHSLASLTSATIDITAPAAFTGNQVTRGNNSTAAINIIYRGSVQAVAGSEIPSSYLTTNDLTSRTANGITINNSAGLLLNYDVILTSNGTPLTFTNGIISLGNGVTLTCNNLPAAGSTTSFIQGGTVAIRVRSDNTAPVNFPIGSGGEYRKVTFGDMKSVGSPATFVSISLGTPTGGTAGSGLSSITSSRRWLVKILPSGPANTVYNAIYKSINFTFGNSDGGSNVSAIGTSTTLGGAYEALANTSITSNIITATNSNDWNLSTTDNYFTLGTAGTLPVDLLYFNAVATHNKEIKLTWKTASEIANKTFTVQRSTDGISFQDILEIKAKYAGYDYVDYDRSPISGTNYYRLVQFDQNGTSSILKYASAEANLHDISVSYYPNPVIQTLNLSIPNLQDDFIQVNLFDTSGKSLWSKQLAKEQLKTDYAIDMGYVYKKGIYILTVEAKDISKKIKVIKN